MELCEERPEDWHEVEALMDLCFAPGRTALSSYRLRDGVDPVRDLCLLLREDGVLRAAIRFWPVDLFIQTPGPEAGERMRREA